MEGERMAVYMFLLWDMQLHNRFLWKPEEPLHSTHLIPGRTPILQTHTDMLPSIFAFLTWTDEHPQIPIYPVNDKSAEVISSNRLILLCPNTVLLCFCPGCWSHLIFPSICIQPLSILSI